MPNEIIMKPPISHIEHISDPHPAIACPTVNDTMT